MIDFVNVVDVDFYDVVCLREREKLGMRVNDERRGWGVGGEQR